MYLYLFYKIVAVNSHRLADFRLFTDVKCMDEVIIGREMRPGREIVATGIGPQ